MNKRIAALLVIALLIPLVGCSGTSGAIDVPPSSNSIESTQTPSETPETPSEAIESTDPTPSEKPIEATQEPIESESPEETIAPTIEPTKQPEQTSPPASSAPVSTPTPTPTSSPAPTQTHIHSYTSMVTKEATCNVEGIRTYTCSCGDSYNETIGRTDSHNWSIRHIDEVGHYESSGTHQVEARRCDCGFRVDIAGTTDTENIAIWNNHKTTCTKSHIYWIKDVPNDPQYIIDTPAHDETYCTICGAIQ